MVYVSGQENDLDCPLILHILATWLYGNLVQIFVYITYLIFKGKMSTVFKLGFYEFHA